MQTRLRTLRHRNYEVDLDYKGRVIIRGDLFIDYNCFRKSLAEKRALKLAKWNCKNEK